MSSERKEHEECFVTFLTSVCLPFIRFYHIWINLPEPTYSFPVEDGVSVLRRLTQGDSVLISYSIIGPG